MTRHAKGIGTAWLRRYVALTAALVLVSGCAAVNRLREAQDAFNQGAAAENAQRLTPGDATEAVTALTSVRTSYASALQSLEHLSDREQTSLKNDGLWGAALTLKALCQWRLGEYGKALDSATEARANTGAQIYPRDQALLVALPGLIKTDQAFAKTHQGQSLTEINELLVGPNGAVNDIAAGRNAVGPNHPVQVYLIQGQLAAYRNYMEAAWTLNRATIPATDPARVAAEANLKALNDVLKALATGDGERTRLVAYWAKLLALPGPV